MFDQRLMKAVAEQEPQARERFVREHYARAYRFLLRLTFGHEEAKDLTQQTFVIATSKAAGFRGECSLATWIQRIAYHEYTRWLKANHRKELPEAQDIAARGSIDDHTEAIVLAEALQSISPLLRESFLLHEVVGLNVREVSALLQCPTGTVKWRLRAARIALRERLEETNYETPESRIAFESRGSST